MLSYDSLLGMVCYNETTNKEIFVLWSQPIKFHILHDPNHFFLFKELYSISFVLGLFRTIMNLPSTSNAASYIFRSNHFSVYIQHCLLILFDKSYIHLITRSTGIHFDFLQLFVFVCSSLKISKVKKLEYERNWKMVSFRLICYGLS